GIFIDPGWSPEEARALAEAAIPELEALGDHYGLALAWRLMGEAECGSGRFEEWGRANQIAADHAHRADDWGNQQALLGDLAQALVFGPTPVPEAIRRCHQILSEIEQGSESRLWVVRAIALLEAMLGHFDRATALLAEAREGDAELGVATKLTNQWEIEGQIALLAGDPAGA